MPEIIGAIILAAIPGPFAIGSASAISVGSVSIGASTIGSAAILATSVALNYALTPAPKQPKPADGLLSIKQTVPSRQGGYGRDRVAGSYMLYEAGILFPFYVSGDVIALIGGRICGFKQYFLNDDAVSMTGTIVNGMGDGRYAGGIIRVESRIGLETETSYSLMTSTFGAVWTSDHRGDGIASLMLACAQADTSEHQSNVYPNGKPEPSAVCDLYPIWDPRDGAQDPDDPATWIAAATFNLGTTYAADDRVIYLGAPYYSYAGGNVGFAPDLYPNKWCAVLSNPVLQLIDFLTDSDHGMGLDRETIITPVIDSLKAKATLCDALVLDKDGNFGPRYTSNGKFNFDDDPADVFNAILATCDGWTTEGELGSLILEVGVYSAPTVTIASQHIVGFSINYGIADEQVVNELTLTFTDPDNNYKQVPGQAWRNEDDISARGRVRSQSLALNWVHRHSQARRLSKRVMARLSAPHGTVTTTLSGIRALDQRWVNIAYPFLPGMGTDDDPVIVEFSSGTVDYMAGTVTFEWVLVDPDTIDAWDAVVEEGDGPGMVADNNPPALDFSKFSNSISYSYA